MSIEPNACDMNKHFTVTPWGPLADRQKTVIKLCAFCTPVLSFKKVVEFTGPISPRVDCKELQNH